MACCFFAIDEASLESVGLRVRWRGLAGGAVTIPGMDKVRIDKWLWAARFFKTRSLATEEILKGRVAVNEQVAKPARDIKPGDWVSIRQNGVTRTVQVLALSQMRGPATVAQTLYAETPESIQARELAQQQRRFGSEPALSIASGRPTKRDRRELEEVNRGWNDRWRASL